MADETYEIPDIVFYLMSYSESDAEPWDIDSYEYIRINFHIFEDFVFPVTAAQTLLHYACKKRKVILLLWFSLQGTDGGVPDRGLVHDDDAEDGGQSSSHDWNHG